MDDNVSVLIVSGRRADRRVLFDALDSQDLQSIYTAKNTQQAREFLSQVQISLLIIDLGLDLAPVQELLAAFHANDRQHLCRVLAIMPPPTERGAWSWEYLPKQVTECIQSPVDGGEVLFRLARLWIDASVAPAAEADHDAEMDLLFAGVDDEYVLSDAKTGKIIAVNAAFSQRSGDNAKHWLGEPLSRIGLDLDDEARRVYANQLHNEGRARYRCHRQLGVRGSYPVEVRQRLGMLRGNLVHLTALHDRSALVALEQRVALAARVYSPEDHGLSSSRIADSIGENLGLDYFMVAVYGHAPDDVPQVLAAYCRGELSQDLSDPAKHLPYRKLRDGQVVLAPDNAVQSLGQDRFLVENGIESYIGLPLRRSDQTVIGVLIAARKSPITAWSSAVSVLKVVAAYFAREHEIRDLRLQGEDIGLHDGLTKLPNRMLFNDRLAHALGEATRTGELFAVMFVDLDRFKNINDSLGHGVGDQVLVGVAKKLMGGVRSSDTVARYAGDEFTIVLRHIIQKDDVLRVAQKINKVLAEPLRLQDGTELQITASIGVSFYPDDGISAEALLKRADVAMYSAKGLGRNTCQAYVDQGEETHQQKLVLESKLRQAEANSELRVFYQPQVLTASEDIVGMEALIRWEHPELGLISPGFFIPLAEETGLIVSIGEWLMRKACRQTREWQERFGLNLNLGVNLSPLQLRQPNLIAVVESALNDAGLHPNSLDLEVTESLSIKTIPGLCERLEQLRELGCRISIDDFGTGQSSLDYLKRFPADCIKIDQSFVRNIGMDPDDEAIVEATINMAHSLKLQVVAEGVEEEHHLDFLRGHSCDQLQGFLFCRPLPADSFSRLLMEREALTVKGVGRVGDGA